MKKGLFSLIAAAIALVSFSKKDDSNLTFKSADLKVTDGSSNSLKEYSFTRNTDTTKKGGGRRGDEIPYRGTGNGGKEGTGGKGEKVTSDPGTGGNGKTSGGKNTYTPYRTTGGSGKEGHGGNGKKDTRGNGGSGKEGAGGKSGKVTSDPGTGGSGKEGTGGDGKKEAVIFRQQKSN